MIKNSASFLPGCVAKAASLLLAISPPLLADIVPPSGFTDDGNSTLTSLTVSGRQYPALTGASATVVTNNTTLDIWRGGTSPALTAGSANAAVSGLSYRDVTANVGIGTIFQFGRVINPADRIFVTDLGIAGSVGDNITFQLVNSSNVVLGNYTLTLAPANFSGVLSGPGAYNYINNSTGATGSLNNYAQGIVTFKLSDFVGTGDLSTATGIKLSGGTIFNWDPSVVGLATPLEQDATDFAAHHVTNPAMLPLIKTAGNLSGRTVPYVYKVSPDVKGWFEYRVGVKEAGWYELLVYWNTAAKDYHPNGPEKDTMNNTGTTGIFYPTTKYSIREARADATASYFKSSFPTNPNGTGVFKPGNIWLEPNGDGSPKEYILRFEKYFDSEPFIPITKFALKKIASNFATNLRVFGGDSEFHVGNRYAGFSESIPVKIQGGGGNPGGTLVVEVWKDNATTSTASQSVVFSNSPTAETQLLNIPTPNVEGSYSLKYKVGSSYVAAEVNLPPLPFRAIDDTPATAPANTDLVTSPVVEIDCATQAPDYFGGDADSQFDMPDRTMVTTSAEGLTYRVSGNNGYADVAHRDADTKPTGYITWANYFAYTLPANLEKGKLYLLEVDYPDNQDRSFMIQVRQDGARPYQVRTSGVDTGGPFPPTKTMKTHRIFFWPDKAGTATANHRVVILNYQPGWRAAVSKIRLSQVTGELPWLVSPGTPAGRHFGHWFEEAFSFSMTYGDGGVETMDSFVMASMLKRWAKMMKYLGGDTLWVCATSYDECMYPSLDFQKAKSAPNTEDYFKLILLVAKKYGLRVMADFFPRPSEELLTKYIETSDPNRLYAVNFEGKLYDGSGVNSDHSPVLNPSHPDNRQWIKGMLKEFVLRYKNDPAFAGVSLRAMDWQNTGLHNFHSIEWGYDKATADLYAQKGGPADPGTPAGRFSAYTGNAAALQSWNTFRQGVIHDLYADLQAELIDDPAVCPVNPEFEIHAATFLPGRPSSFDLNTTLRPDRPAAGLVDIQDIPNFRYDKAGYGYGRHRDSPTKWASDRLPLTSETELTEFASSGSYFLTANYAEDGGKSVPNSYLGLASFTNGSPWTSGHLVPSGRFNLERYALAMAAGDATMLVNGGNNYFLDQESTREFLKEYNQIPTAPFVLAPGSLTSHNAVVRHLPAGGGTSHFYVVNRSSSNRSVTVAFSNDTGGVCPATNQAWSTTQAALRVSLQPFQMIVYSVNSGASITNVSVDTPWVDSVEAVTSHSVQLVWSPVPSATGYLIERREEGGEFAKIGDLSPNATPSFTDAGTRADSAYEYRIQAITGSGNTGWSKPVFVATPPEGAPTAPHRPGFLVVTSGTHPDLTWKDGSLDETTFQVQRRVANGDWLDIQTLPANTTHFTDTTVQAGLLYEYRVRATNAAGNSSWATAVNLRHVGVATVDGPVQAPGGGGMVSLADSPGNSYGPPGFAFLPPAVPFVTGQTLSTTIRSDYTGWVGMKITTGAAPVVVRELGRWVISGNTAAHTVKIVEAATGIDVPGGSVSVATSGAPAGFKYVALSQPVTLAANTAYYLLSKETLNGDKWYQGNSTLSHDTSIATINNAASTADGVTFNNALGAGNCHVPLAFKYSPAPREFVSSHSMTALRNDLTGWLGMKITVGDSDLLLNQLGRWVAPGNSASHTVKVVNVSTGSEVAVVTVDTLGAPANQYVYASLAAPVLLAANTSYYVLSQETSGGDQWYDFSTSTAAAATGYQTWLLAHRLPMDESGQGSSTATPANDGLPNLVKYALGLDPRVGGSGGRLNYGQLNVSGADYLTFTYTCPARLPADIAYTVEASSDLSSSTWSSSGLVVVTDSVNGDLRTITVRDTVSLPQTPRRFMRLKVSQP